MWQARKEPPRLADDEVHVWRAALSPPPRWLSAFESTLSEAERARAGQYRFGRDRDHFIAARGLLRRLLGGYLGLEPGAVRFAYGSHGKPEAANEQAGSLAFNLSHAGALALFAFTRGRAVGIDVEEIRPDYAEESIARHFFSPQEVASLLALAPEQRVPAFFRCWTRKEAFVKATGLGLSLPLDQFDVTLEAEARLLRTAWDPAEAANWSLVALDPGPGYAAALAIAGHDWRLRCFEMALPQTA